MPGERFRIFKLSREMDRITGLNRTLDKEVEKDTILLNELVHSAGCGCQVCRSHAGFRREQLRPEGEEPPTTALTVRRTHKA